MNYRLIAQTIKRARDNGRDAPKGYSLLDWGCYGAAYREINTGRVLKIGFTRRDGSMGFIAKCAEFYRKHGRAPEHCVTVFEFGLTSDGWYALMEYVNVGYVPSGMDPYDVREVILPRAVINLVGLDNLVERRFGKTSKYAWDDDVAMDIHSGNYGRSQCGTRLCVFDPFATRSHVKKFPKSVVHARTYGPQRHQGARYAV